MTFVMPMLGAILPLHDVRYRFMFSRRARARWRASASKPRGSMTDTELFFTDEQEFERSPMIPSGGARRDRTDDLLLAKQALSQLSYGPSREQVSGVRYQGQRTS
jgi:hypothetical protein